MSKLREKFNTAIKKELQTELGLKNISAVPNIEKVVVSAHIGAYKEDKEAIEFIAAELATICGQKAKINRSRKSVSAFKLRVGQPVGLTVTLRGDRMYDFISRLTDAALPRVRDFKGLKNKAFDGNGNYTVSVEEHVIMPEIKYEGSTKVFGFQVNIKTTSNKDEYTKLLLTKLGFTFEKIN